MLEPALPGGCGCKHRCSLASPGSCRFSLSNGRGRFSRTSHGSRRRLHGAVHRRPRTICAVHTGTVAVFYGSLRVQRYPLGFLSLPGSVPVSMGEAPVGNPGLPLVLSICSEGRAQACVGHAPPRGRPRGRSGSSETGANIDGRRTSVGFPFKSTRGTIQPVRFSSIPAGYRGPRTWMSIRGATSANRRWGRGR